MRLAHITYHVTNMYIKGFMTESHQTMDSKFTMDKSKAEVAEKSPAKGSKSIDWNSFMHKISDGVTVACSPMVGFSYPPTFWYTVVETGEKFTGNTGKAKEDYKLWKEGQKRKAEWSLFPNSFKKTKIKEEPMDIP